MKRIKFLLALLMVMLGTAVQAQQVVINKSDGSVEVFQPNEVDSVVYKPTIANNYLLGEIDLGNKLTFTTSDLNKYAASKTEISAIKANHATDDTFTVFIWPASWGMPSRIIHDASGKNYIAAWSINDGLLTVPSGYNYGYFQATSSKGETFTIYW